MIKAIIFDLDNTLLDFVKMKQFAVKAAITAMNEAGLETDEDYHRYKSYFNSLVEETIKEIKASSSKLQGINVVKAS